MLIDYLLAYSQGDLYPLHMPGHKRQAVNYNKHLPITWDVTEVEGLDDLHDAHGILRQAMDQTAHLYGAKRTWYLVNGSTCGLLAGIRALAPYGSRVLVARNCHKSVYHAIELGNLRASYLMPPIDPETGIYGSLRPQSVEHALFRYPDTRLVVITSPTYEGVISDIRSIANICHRYGAALLVDEAHGAHFGIHFPGIVGDGLLMPESALHLGADLVVQSAHKTLPSLTQTAFLHLPEGSMAKEEEVERQLGIFETSSPSYPLLASLDACTQWLHQCGSTLFHRWQESLDAFESSIMTLRNLQVVGHGRRHLSPLFFDFDPSKLPISCCHTPCSGPELAKILRQEFRFETEMACGDLVLAMTSLMDYPEVLMRFGEALMALDSRLEYTQRAPALTVLPRILDPLCTIGSAVTMPMQEIPLSKATARISGEYVWAYPPGVPLIAPGETVTKDFLACCKALRETGTELHRSPGGKDGFIRVLA